MISDAGRFGREITTVMEIVEQHTISFLREQLNLVAGRIEHRMFQDERVVLRAVTAVIGISINSQEGIFIVYSFDDLLIRTMAKRYTAELSIAAEEEELYIRETASDVVNVIVGNSTADLARQGELITLWPPILMVEGHTIYGRPKSETAALTLHFPEGSLDVTSVGPGYGGIS
jgi:hypothetical protein